MRRKFRRQQAAAMVRDCPDVALEVLKKYYGLEVPPGFCIEDPYSPKVELD